MQSTCALTQRHRRPNCAPLSMRSYYPLRTGSGRTSRYDSFQGIVGEWLNEMHTPDQRSRRAPTGSADRFADAACMSEQRLKATILLYSVNPITPGRL
jgi:hypothetical protein